MNNFFIGCFIALSIFAIALAITANVLTTAGDDSDIDTARAVAEGVKP